MNPKHYLLKMTKEEHKHLRKTAAEYEMTIKDALLAGIEELNKKLSIRTKLAQDKGE